MTETSTQNKKNHCYVIQVLKTELKNKDYSHLMKKARFQLRYVSGDKKIYSSIVSNSFAAQRNSFPEGIIKTDILRIILFTTPI